MNIFRLSNSILNRLMLGVVIIALIGAVVRHTVLTNFLRKDLEAVVSAQQLALAEYVAQDIDHSIRIRQSLLANASRSLPLDLLKKPNQLTEWLRLRQETFPLFTLGLVVIDTNGVVIADYPPIPKRKRLDISGKPEYEDLMSGKQSVGRPVMSAVLKQPVLPISEPIYDDALRLKAFLVGVVALDAPGMLDTLQNGQIGKTGGFLLVSPRDGLFVSASDPAMILKPTPPPGVNPLHDRAMAGYRGTGVTTNAMGVEEVSAIVSVNSTDWFVVARIPTEEAFATLGRLKTLIFNASLVVVTLALLLIGWIAWRLFKPLFDAARQAEQMTLGNAPLEPLKVVRNDEIGHLTTAFNRLLVKLLGSQAELDRMAHHDTLTGLPNRRLLADRLEQALSRSHRNQTVAAVFFMDLDGFKPINDNYGHEAGDEALRIIARRLNETVRREDTVARVGGDEFVVLVPDLAGTAEAVQHKAETIAEKCLAAIARPLTIQSTQLEVGASIGIAFSAEQSTPDTLLNAADTAMYQAKHLGRGRYVIA